MGNPGHGLTRLERMISAQTETPIFKDPQAFGRIAPKNPIAGKSPDGKPFTRETMVAALSAIAEQMDFGVHAALYQRSTGPDYFYSDRSAPDPFAAEGRVACGMTFLGQMVDHDITLDASSAIGSHIDPADIHNIRTPALDLDCVYGNGPEASPWLYHPKHKGFLLFGTSKNPRDLARNSHGTALIGDPRNDENLVVSQLQGVFITFHNIVLTHMMDRPEMVSRIMSGLSPAAQRDAKGEGTEQFAAARELVRQHFRWLVQNDLLPSFVDHGVLAKVYKQLKQGTLPEPFKADSPMIPIEFSAAAFRFGHAAINENYTLSDGKNADLTDILGFGPKSDVTNNIDFGWFFWGGPNSQTLRMANPIGRIVAPGIFKLPETVIGEGIMFGDTKIERDDAAKLPLRNLLRDRLTFELASGEQMADLIGTPRLETPPEITAQRLTQTPLWYYCLYEAESHGGKLGPVGGTIVATTILRLLDRSLKRYANRPDVVDWDAPPRVRYDDGSWSADGGGLLGVEDGRYCTGFLTKYVEEHRSDITIADDLICG